MKQLTSVPFLFTLGSPLTKHTRISVNQPKPRLGAVFASLTLFAAAAFALGATTMQAQRAKPAGEWTDLAGTAGAGAPSAYHDPQGRYSLTVPDGWNIASDNGNVTLSSGAGWVSVTTASGAQPSDVNHQIVQQIQAQYKNFQIMNEGDFQNNGHPAHGTNATGINPKGVRVSVLVVSIGAGSGHYLILISSAPNEQAQQINGIAMQIAQSVRFAGE